MATYYTYICIYKQAQTLKPSKCYSCNVLNTSNSMRNPIWQWTMTDHELQKHNRGCTKLHWTHIITYMYVCMLYTCNSNLKSTYSCTCCCCHHINICWQQNVSIAWNLLISTLQPKKRKHATATTRNLMLQSKCDCHCEAHATNANKNRREQ